MDAMEKKESAAHALTERRAQGKPGARTERAMGGGAPPSKSRSMKKNQYLTGKKHNFANAEGKDASGKGASRHAGAANQFTDPSLERKAMEADQIDQIGNDLLINLKDQLTQMKHNNDENNRVLYDQFLDHNLQSNSSLFQNSRKEMSQKSLNFISPTFNKEMANMFEQQHGPGQRRALQAQAHQEKQSAVSFQNEHAQSRSDIVAAQLEHEHSRQVQRYLNDIKVEAAAKSGRLEKQDQALAGSRTLEGPMAISPIDEAEPVHEEHQVRTVQLSQGSRPSSSSNKKTQPEQVNSKNHITMVDFDRSLDQERPKRTWQHQFQSKRTA